MVMAGLVIRLHRELVASVKTTGIKINRLYTIRLRKFGNRYNSYARQSVKKLTSVACGPHRGNSSKG